MLRDVEGRKHILRPPHVERHYTTNPAALQLLGVFGSLSSTNPFDRTCLPLAWHCHAHERGVCLCQFAKKALRWDSCSPCLDTRLARMATPASPILGSVQRKRSKAALAVDCPRKVSAPFSTMHHDAPHCHKMSQDVTRPSRKFKKMNQSRQSRF